MEWKPIDTAPKNGTQLCARDADGNQRWTWFDCGDWLYTTWRENEDQDEYEADEAWEPTEWAAPSNDGEKHVIN